MEYNLVATGIRLIGSKINNIAINNNVVNIENDSKKKFGLCIKQPSFEEIESGILSIMTIDFAVELEQNNKEQFKMEMSVEGAFLSENGVNQEEFESLVAINGASAIIGIARGKIESITSSIFNQGKIVIPFVNVIDYYESLTDEND